MDIGTIFAAVGHAKRIAELLRLIDSIDAKVDRLLRADLDAGVRALRQSLNSEPERLFLLREARQCFNRAISLESSLRRGLAYLGLAYCHHAFDDVYSRDEALNQILDIDPLRPMAQITEGAKDILLGKSEPIIDSPLPSPVVIIFNNPLSILALAFSSRSRKAFSERTKKRAIQNDPQAVALVSLQKSVAEYLTKQAR